MKKLFLFPILMLVSCLLAGCSAPDRAEPEQTTFILVRHTEKADDGTEDPPLNEKGEARALALADHLKETDITAVYSTNYKRTISTVQGIADHKGLRIKMYDPFADSTLATIIEREAGGTVLLSGHSNTTPMLLNKLIGEERYRQFEDADYDNLFIVVAREEGKGTALKLTF